MDVLSNAFFLQAEITQTNRWDLGPLELHIVPEPKPAIERLAFSGRVCQWNCRQCAGFLRSEHSFEMMEEAGLVIGDNPNIVFAPSENGYSELHGMIGSLLPDEVLRHHKIRRPISMLWLSPCSEAMRFRGEIENIEQFSFEELDRQTGDHLGRLASAIPGAFEEWIWSQLVTSRRFAKSNFSKHASLRMLAGDVRFWMNRLYRIAIDLYEGFPATEHEEKSWNSLDVIQKSMNEVIPPGDRSNFVLARPRTGGTLWDPENPDDREWITQLLINGNDTVESLQPVVEVLLGSAAPEDFSDRFSWIKEDFERSFYSKRSKVKVTLHEFIDECAVHDGAETPGYGDILFRDLMAFFDPKDRRIILALRQGKTRSEIAEELGHSGHAAISRRVKRIEKRMRKLLEQ